MLNEIILFWYLLLDYEGGWRCALGAFRNRRTIGVYCYSPTTASQGAPALPRQWCQCLPATHHHHHPLLQPHPCFPVLCFKCIHGTSQKCMCTSYCMDKIMNIYMHFSNRAIGRCKKMYLMFFLLLKCHTWCIDQHCSLILTCLHIIILQHCRIYFTD